MSARRKAAPSEAAADRCHTLAAALLTLLLLSSAAAAPTSATPAADPPSAAATAPQAQIMPAAEDAQLTQLALQCPASVRYEISLGQGPAAPQVPIFVAVLTLQNNVNYTVDEWRLGWHFPYGSVIKTQQDVFDPHITLMSPDSVDTSLESLFANRSIGGGEELLFSFLGTKGAGPVNASNPYNVGAIEQLAFNNLRCTMLNSGAAADTLATGATAPPPVPAASQAPVSPTDLQIEYTPIEYLGQPIVSTFTQFLVRLRNIRNTTAIDMSAIQLEYWFEGPLEGAPMFAQRAPDQFFSARCEWASTGCDSVELALQAGYEQVPGAQFFLQIALNSKAGLLLPSGEHAVPAFFLGKGIDVMDVLITLTTKRGVSLLNSTQDYSFLETPELEVPPNSTIIPRRALPNPHIPAFLNNTLVWGVLPTPPASGPAGDAPGAEAPGTGSSSTPGLPAGITCESVQSGTGLNCGLVAIYCCEAVDPQEELSPFIPDTWPPPLPAPASEAAAVPIPQQHTPGGVSPGGEPAPGAASNGTLGAGATPGSEPKTAAGGTGLVAGIVGGVAGAAALAAAAGFILLRRRRQQRGMAAGDGKFLEAVHRQGAGSNSKAGTPRSNGSAHSAAPFAANGNSSSGGGGVPQGSAYKPGNGGPRVALEAVLVPGDAGAPGSVQSSPSKAGSLAPLLRRQLSGGHRSALIKFPSGLSGVSSHDNPMFDEPAEGGWGGQGSTQQSVLPQHVGSWEMQSAVQTQQAYAQAQAAAATQAAAAAAAAARAAQQAQLDEEEEELWRPDVVAMMESKGATAPSLLAPDTRRQRRPRRNASSSDPGGSSSDESEDDRDGHASVAPSDWHLRRSKSWDGHLQHTESLDSLPMSMRRPRGQHQQGLRAPPPPLTALAPPVMLSGPPAPDVDLNADYEREVAPFLGRCLGTGGFGAVYEATWRGRRVAVKKLPNLGPDQPSGESMYAALLREIELASKFSSDRLVKVYGACTADREHVCLIMELLEGGNLFQRIYDRNKRRMSYLEILQLAHDVAAALAYLHPSVVHRDLKPQNILLDSHGRAKLADFGISRVKDPTKSYLSQVTNDNGTPNYMAPEQFNGSRVDEKVDVYALGVILNECYTRRQPWRDSSHFFQIILKVAINGERPWLDPDCPEPLRRLITKCWHQDPHMRPSCAEVMRLTAFMIQEEVHRWEQLQNGGSGGLTRLPIAARRGDSSSLPASRQASVQGGPPDLSPRARPGHHQQQQQQQQQAPLQQALRPPPPPL
ncbi:hypothetical protein ABPG75_010160 [Micractinium tetrahymenae]